MLSETQAQNYLDRIGFAGNPHANRETLDQLVRLHQSSVPFETIALRRRCGAPSLKMDDLYRKIVDLRLGGYCFELNKLFGELLETIGFDVRPVLSRAVRGRAELMPINHRGTLVRLGNDSFSADVGFGGPMPAGALLLADGAEQRICGELYTPRHAEHAWWNIDRITRSTQDLYDDHLPERRQTELALCTARVEEADFDALNLFFSEPGTLFREHDMVNLRCEGGYYSLMDRTLTKRVNGRKEVVELQTPEEAEAALAETFGMEGLSSFPDQRV